MKRSSIKAGVVYAVKSSYGPPSPIVFLEDGAAGLYTRGAYGRCRTMDPEHNVMSHPHDQRARLVKEG